MLKGSRDKQLSYGIGDEIRYRVRSCDYKRRFTTPNEAAEIAKIAPNSDYRRGKLISYKCSFCPGWHIGHEKMRTLRGYDREMASA